MLSLFVNIIDVLLLLLVSISVIKKRVDSSILWYCLCILYFVNFPLLVDSVMILLKGVDKWDDVLSQNNSMWESGLLDGFLNVSLVVLVFNIFTLLTYRLLFSKKRAELSPSVFSDKNYYSWIVYFILSILTLIVFLYSIGITSLNSIAKLQFDWVAGRTNNRYVILLSNILLAALPSCALKTLSTRNFFLGFVALLPIFVIGYITEARSLIISLAFYILFFFIFSQSKVSVKSIIKVSFVAILLVFLMTFFRGSGENLPYPIEKDPCYNDLFYSVKNQGTLSTGGNDTKRLLLTGFYSIEAEDITIKLADTKFTIGWGTLHPTIVGWSYIDLGDFYWVMAIIMGVIMSIADKIRRALPTKYGLIYYSFIFSFVSVAVRGSVQVAYATFFYPTVITIFLLFIYSNKKKNHEKIISN